MKRATAFITDVEYVNNISIHALVKRATIVINGSWRYPSNFNPRPREEGDVYHDIMCIGSLSISIHALVKRATSSDSGFIFSEFISIHALVKRATVSNWYF